MKQESIIKGAIATVFLALVALLFIKPQINTEFHGSYVTNLNKLDSLSGSLVRNLLLVRHGQVKHYDFLEANLQLMARAANLAAITPEHAGNEFAEFANAQRDNYLEQLAKIRIQVELSKRGIGLLANSRSAVTLALDELNKQVLENSANASSNKASLTAIQLNQAIRKENAPTVINGLLDELTSHKIVEPAVLAQIRLHTDIIDSYSQPVHKATDFVYQQSDSLDQPELLRAEYWSRYGAVLATTTWEMWASYALAVCLGGLSILLTIVGSAARKQAEAATLEAEKAREETEERIEETRNAVGHINELLDKISQGDFSDRISLTFSDELETLKHGANNTADRVEFTMEELQRVMTSMQQGNFNTQIDERVTGEFREQVERTNLSLQTTMDSICSVMEDMRNGIFSSRISVELEGSFDVLKCAVNDSMHSLNQSLVEISTVVEKQADGNFTQRITQTWPGELGTLSSSLNSTAEKVHGMVADILSLTSQVTQASQAVLDNSQQLKSKSDEQADSIDTALQSAKNVCEIIEKNRESTQMASSLAAKSHSEAEDCQSVSVEAKQAMESITKKTAEISAITATIETIASKTNLLSLNASVEAARASEHGKGFSVVAGEVKALARMSAEASANIGLLIQDTDKQVRLGSDSVKNTASSLTAIGGSIVNVRDISKNISDALTEQTYQMGAMTDKVSEAFELTRTNQSLANNTHDMSIALEKLASQMSTLVAFFRVDDKEQNKSTFDRAA